MPEPASSCLFHLSGEDPHETKISLKNYYHPLTCHTEEKLGQRFADTFSYSLDLEKYHLLS